MKKIGFTFMVLFGFFLVSSCKDFMPSQRIKVLFKNKTSISVFYKYYSPGEYVDPKYGVVDANEEVTIADDTGEKLGFANASQQLLVLYSDEARTTGLITESNAATYVQEGIGERLPDETDAYGSIVVFKYSLPRR